MSSRDKVRVLYVAGGNVLGGAEMNVLRVLQGSAASSIEPVAVLLPHGSLLVEGVRALGIPVGLIQYYGFRLPNPLRYFQTLWQLYSWIRSSRPDIIHFNHHWFVEYACRIRQIARMPVIADVRGVESDDFMRRHRHWLLGVDRIVAVSDAVRENVLRWQIPNSKIQVIHESIDPAEFLLPSRRHVLRREFGIPADAPLVGIVGRVIREKGIGEFIHAAKAVLQAEAATHFVVVGDDQSQGQDIRAYRELASSLGIADRVFFTGFRSDIADVLHDLDIFVLASWMEGLGNCVLEAMAAGRIVVATDVGGVPEIITDGQTGFLTKAQDPGRLAQDILKALSLPPEERSAMAEAAQARIREHFSIERQLSELEALYASLLSR